MSVITFSFFSKSRQLAAVIMSTINIQIREKNVPQVGTFENSEDVKFTTVEEAGCLNHFNRVQDCMTKNQDWYHDKQCDYLVKDFRECYYNSVQK